MVETLKDPNKLVRWRASRFLYELGDESVQNRAARAVEVKERAALCRRAQAARGICRSRRALLSWSSLNWAPLL